MKRIPLVYILSTGRSGSTLLDVLLGAQGQCWTLGEFQLLGINADRNLPCGCRRPFAGCDFWASILGRVTEEDRCSIGHFRSGRHAKGKVIRWSLLPSLLTGRISRSQQQVAMRYARSNYSILNEVRDQIIEAQGGVRWLIDASKDPYRLLWLQAAGLFDIRVIHLVRKPHGFVSNMARNSTLPPLVSTFKYAGRWMAENLIAITLMRRMFERSACRPVSYEALASKPEETVASLCQWLDIPCDSERARTTRQDVNHGVAGSRPRWDDQAVSLREGWRSTMPALHQRLVSVVTSPFNLFRDRRTNRPS